MSELLRLAELCEKAEGADRELDALAYFVRAGIDPIRRDGALWASSGDHDGQSYLVMYAGKPGTVRDFVPRYTASLDAAMTLVPEGWSKSVMDADNGDALAELWTYTANAETRAKTWPLALCAAALRARASTEAAG